MYKDYTINLADYLAKGSKCFIGRDTAYFIKEKSGLNAMFESNPNVYLVIPDGLYCISVSFFESLFCDLVGKHGKEKFWAKVSVIEEGDYSFLPKLKEAVDNIQKYVGNRKTN